MNVEYVFLILTGISQFMERDDIENDTIEIEKNHSSTKVMFKFMKD